MQGLIVITGLDRLAAAERWTRLINPLAARLEESGLGEILDLAEFRTEFHAHGSIATTEVAIRLKNLLYGKELVESVAMSAGLAERDRTLPKRWRSFHCDDYFSSQFCREGYWDEVGQYWYLVPFDQVFEHEDVDFLKIGGAGVNGIRFGYKRGQIGIWAYPVDGEFLRLADTVQEFLQGWLSGTIRI